MAKHQPYKNIKKFLITERSLNYILRPVQVRKENYPYTYSIENMDKEVSVTIDRAWTSANHMVLDFIGHELFEREYSNADEKKRNTWKNDLSLSLLSNIESLMDLKDFAIPPHLEPHIKISEELGKIKAQNEKLTDLIHNLDGEELEKFKREFASNQQRIAELEAQAGLENLHDLEILSRRWHSVKLYVIELDRSKFVERYKDFFKDRRTEYLTELIKRTSEARFSMEYPIQTPVIKEYNDQGKTGSKIVGTRLETVRIENDKLFNYKIDNNKIKIAFNTFLGRAFAHNLLTLNTDWFEESFLELNGHASAIYRRFFVTRSGDKVDELPITHLVDYFGLSGNSRYPEAIKGAFEDIKRAGLIADYRLRENGGKFSKGLIEVEKSSK